MPDRLPKTSSRRPLSMPARRAVARSPGLQDAGDPNQTLMRRIIQLIQLDTLPRFPGAGRDLLLPWAPAFAGVAGLVWAMAVTA